MDEIRAISQSLEGFEAREKKIAYA
jgi:hypothetical protein